MAVSRQGGTSGSPSRDFDSVAAAPASCLLACQSQPGYAARQCTQQAHPQADKSRYTTFRKRNSDCQYRPTPPPGRQGTQGRQAASACASSGVGRAPAHRVRTRNVLLSALLDPRDVPAPTRHSLCLVLRHANVRHPGSSVGSVRRAAWPRCVGVRVSPIGRRLCHGGRRYNLVLGGANDSDGSTSITRSGGAINTALVVYNDNGSAVQGEAIPAGTGVTGTSETGVGVHGRVENGVGVEGRSVTRVGVDGRFESSSACSVKREWARGT